MSSTKLSKPYNNIMKNTWIALLISSLLIGCAATPVPTDSNSCLALGKQYKRERKFTKAIQVLESGARINLPEGRTQAAFSCAEELIGAYSQRSYDYLHEHRQAEAEADLRRAKEMWVYTFHLNYGPNLSAERRASLMILLQGADRAFDHVAMRVEGFDAMNRASNAQLVQQVGSSLSQSGQLANEVISRSGQSGGGATILSHGGIYGNRRTSSTAQPGGDIPNALQGKGCPGQTCDMGCSQRYDSSQSRPAIVCSGRNCGQKGSCNF